jgi:hypothetical protein
LGENSIYWIQTILELIAVASVINEINHPDENPSILRAFENFIDDVRKIEKLKLAFEKDAHGYWDIKKSEGMKKLLFY